MSPKTLTTTRLLYRGILMVLLTYLWASWISGEIVAAKKQLDRNVKVTANFTGRVLRPTDRIVLTFDTTESLTKSQFAVLIGLTDMTSLFDIDSTRALYVPNHFPLPAGETAVVVYLMEPSGDWFKLDEFLLKVESEPANGSSTDADPTEATLGPRP